MEKSHAEREDIKLAPKSITVENIRKNAKLKGTGDESQISIYFYKVPKEIQATVYKKLIFCFEVLHVTVSHLPKMLESEAFPFLNGLGMDIDLRHGEARVYVFPISVCFGKNPKKK